MLGFNYCERCGSAMRRRCANEDSNGVPCLGMSDEEAAIYRAKEQFVRDEIDFDTMQAQISQALVDPPPRRFYTVLEWR